MAQPRGRQGLPLGPRRRLALARDDLQRDVEAGALVAREPDRARAAAAERAQGPIALRNELAGGKGKRRLGHETSGFRLAGRNPAPAVRLGRVSRLFPAKPAPMTENDTDIDFDFFEDEPPTEESSRAERLIPRRGPRGPAAAAAHADQPDAAAAADRPDRLRDPDRRPARVLDPELPGEQQGQDLQELHGQGLRRRRLVAADRQAAQPVLLAQGLKEAQRRAARLRPRAPGAARRPARARDHAAGDAARRAPGADPGAAVPRQRPERPRERARRDRRTPRTPRAPARCSRARCSACSRATSSTRTRSRRLPRPSSTRQGVTGTNDAGGPLVPDSNFLQSSDLVTPTAMVDRDQPHPRRRVHAQHRRPARHEPRLGQGAAGRDGAEHLDADDGHRPHEHVDRRDGRGLRRLAGGEHPGDAHGSSRRACPPCVKHATIGFINPGEQKTVSFTNFPAPSFRNPGADQGRGAARAGRVQHEQQLGRLSRHLLRRVGLELL